MLTSYLRFHYAEQNFAAPKELPKNCMYKLHLYTSNDSLQNSGSVGPLAHVIVSNALGDARYLMAALFLCRL